MGRRKSKRGATTARAARRKARKRRERISVREKKIFRYRGYTLEELLELSFEEQIALLPARIRRTLDRGYNIENLKLRKKLLEADEKTVVRTHVRAHVVLPDYVGQLVAVYNGMDYKTIKIIPEMIGHYLGEFAPTRKDVRHSGPGVGATRSSKFMPKK